MACLEDLLLDKFCYNVELFLSCSNFLSTKYLSVAYNMPLLLEKLTFINHCRDCNCLKTNVIIKTISWAKFAPTQSPLIFMTIMNFSEVVISFSHCMEKNYMKHCSKFNLSESKGLEDIHTPEQYCSWFSKSINSVTAAF